jgi:hypothetical protein
VTVAGPFSFVHEAELSAGLRAGAVGALGAGAVGLLWMLGSSRRGDARPAPVAGLLLVAAAAYALDDSIGIPRDVVVGLIALGAAGFFVDVVHLPVGVLLPLSVPGAWLIANSDELVDVGWIRIVVGVTAALGGTLVADFDRHWRDRAYGPILLVISFVGVYYAVPDTEQATAVLAAALPFVLVSFPVALASLGAGGAAAGAGLLGWTVAAGGFGRTPSVVGGAACLGLLAAAPLARLIERRSLLDTVARERWGVVLVAGVHLTMVTVASRVAGVGDDLTPAVVVVVVELVAATAALVVLSTAAVADSP